MTLTTVEPTPTQLAILRAIPTSPEGGATTEQVWKAAQRAGLNTGKNPDGTLTVHGYPIEKVLRFMKRTGWTFLSKHKTPHRWCRTPMGTDAVRRNTTRMTTTPRQEATR